MLYVVYQCAINTKLWIAKSDTICLFFLYLPFNRTHALNTLDGAIS